MIGKKANKKNFLGSKVEKWYGFNSGRSCGNEMYLV